MEGFIKVIGTEISESTSAFRRSEITEQSNYLNDV